MNKDDAGGLFFLPVVVLPAGGLPAGNAAYVNLITVAPDSGFIDLLYQFLDRNPAIRFSFHFEEPSLFEKYARQLLPFFFLPGSDRIDGQLWVTIPEGMTEPDELAASLQAQGFAGPRILRLGMGQHTGVPRIFDTVPSPEEMLKHPLHANLIFLQGKEPATVPHLLLSIPALEQKIREYDPGGWQLREKLAAVQSENRVLLAANLSLHQELRNFRDYNKLLQLSHEGNEIQEFYNNEYEVLPRWYKRLGHIVKWVMGKRKWKAVPVAGDKGRKV
ncbi:MAG: hypothetical protein EOO09_06340 [Chitinophagaceae bacterium]|nr:MAG: hypothetical protein EOO09_06340 [Chitinophagaceae bacterium]